MNFKPTLLKIIISLIAALFVILFNVAILQGGEYYHNLYNSVIDKFIYWFSALVIIYVVWSLIQKKK